MSWIKHNGNGNPVPSATFVTARKRDLTEVTKLAMDHTGWTHTYSTEDIMEYKTDGTLGELMSAFQRQEGGDHYVKMAIQPSEYIHKNGIGYMEGTAITYLSRWKAKGGVQDLKKAIHTIEQLIEMEEKK